MKKSKTLISAGELITLAVLAMTVFGFSFVAGELSLTGFAVSKTPSVGVSHAPGNPAVGQIVTISVNASGEKGARVRIYVDNLLRKTCLVGVNCSYSAKYQAGNHTYYALAIDRFSNRARDPVAGSKTFSVRLSKDTVPPKLRVYTSSDVIFSGKKATVIAAASDDFGLASISIYVNGASVNTCPTSGRSDSCRHSFTPKAGNYTYFATALDAAGNAARDPASGSKVIVVR